MKYLKCSNCEDNFNLNYISKKAINMYPIKYTKCKDCRLIKNCGNCGNIYKHRQNQTCSYECAESLKTKSYMRTQGSSHNFSKDSKSRINFENKLFVNEGISNVFQRESVKNSIEETILKRYGVSNISKSDNIKEKKKETLSRTLSNNPNLFKHAWWDNHHRFIKELGYDPRLGMFGKSSNESMVIFNPIIDFCINSGVKRSDIYIGINDSSEYFINTGTKTYFYDFCIRSKKLIIEYHGIGFHANPQWDPLTLNEWRSVFTNETSTENIRKTKIKNNSAMSKGFKLFEIWGDSCISNNIEICKNFIKSNI